MSDQNFTYGAAQNLTANAFTRLGYTFQGWATTAARANAGTVDHTNGKNVSNLTTANGATVDLYAVWTPNTYAITLDANTGNHGYGSNTTATAVYDSIALRTFTATAAVDGYHVDGYYTDATGGTKVLDSIGRFAASSVTGYITSNKWSRTTTPTTLHAHMEGNNFTVKFNKNNGSATGTMEDQDFIYGTTENLTANGFELAGHNFAGWNTKADGTGKTYTDQLRADTITTTNDTTINLYAVWSVSSHAVTFTKDNATYGTLSGVDGNDQVTNVAHNAPITIRTGANANKLYIGVTRDTVITATAIDEDDFFRYTFDGWYNEATEPATQLTDSANTVSADMTITAHFTRNLKDEITLRDTENDAYYDKVKEYNGETVDVTYERTTANGTDWGTNWSTLCLPFDVDEENMAVSGLPGRVYQFNYAVGNASSDPDGGLELHFGKAETMVAGKGYLVKDRNNPIRPIDGTLDFYEVTINTTADNSEDVTDLVGYNNGEGVIKLVGTLRKFILPARNHQYMGLKNNVIYYPGSNTQVPAYRAFFKFDEGNVPAVAPRVRIVVEDEQATPIEVIEMDGEGNLMPVSGDEVRKYIEDGVLIIERNGKRYNAVGAEL